MAAAGLWFLLCVRSRQGQAAATIQEQQQQQQQYATSSGSQQEWMKEGSQQWKAASRNG